VAPDMQQVGGDSIESMSLRPELSG